MKGSEVLAALEQGKKVRIKTWFKGDYIEGKIPPYKSQISIEGWLSEIKDLYREWEEYIPEEPVLSYREALTQLKVGDKVKVIKYSDDNKNWGCTDYVGFITNKAVNNRIIGNEKSLLLITLEEYPNQTHGLPESCQVQKVL